MKRREKVSKSLDKADDGQARMLRQSKLAIQMNVDLTWFGCSRKKSYYIKSPKSNRNIKTPKISNLLNQTFILNLLKYQNS